jgi:hypothetical protein
MDIRAPCPLPQRSANSTLRLPDTATAFRPSRSATEFHCSAMTLDDTGHLDLPQAAPVNSQQLSLGTATKKIPERQLLDGRRRYSPVGVHLRHGCACCRAASAACDRVQRRCLVSATDFTDDDVEITLGVNHLGHFAFVRSESTTDTFSSPEYDHSTSGVPVRCPFLGHHLPSEQAAINDVLAPGDESRVV